jgi:UDP-N-acetylmuramyl pentapeptide synthase
VRTAPDAATALEIVREMAEPGDTVLVKASRVVGLEVVATRLLEGAP